ncbi:MAG: hypothetical protein M1812_002237 [Candelaria pacifica]|nr:MAG: hypothetical protein M1812_002237 [Candelaria pacifica]
MHIFGCVSLLSFLCFAVTATTYGGIKSSTRTRHHVRRSIDLSDQPTNLNDLLSMKITANGATAIDIELKNHHTEPAAILKWNTILESFPPQGTFIKFSQKKQSSEASSVVTETGNRVQAQYWKVYPEHFLVLAPQQAYKRTLDLQELFQIDDVHEYSLVLVDFFRVIFGDHVDLTAVQRSDIPDLPYVRVGDYVQQLKLNVVSASGGLRKRATPCSPGQAVIVDRARTAAKVLAGFTSRNLDPDIWREYFNGIGVIQSLVSGIYNKIESYTPTKNLLTELCDSGLTEVTKNVCVQGMAAYHARGWSKELVFCNDFFSDELQRNKDCEACGPNGPFDMTDPSGVFLHELTHVEELVGRDIRDGKKCVTSTAASRPSPRFDNLPSPNLLATDLLEGLPEDIASAYELYAYAIRANACGEGRWPESSKRLSYCWTRVKQGCRKCTEIAQNAVSGLGVLVLGVPGVAGLGLGVCADEGSVLD